MNQKGQMRKTVFIKSQAFSASQLEQGSTQIVNRAYQLMMDQQLFNLPQLRVGLYHSIKREVNLSPLFPFFSSLGWTLYFPKVFDPETRAMKFFEVTPEALKPHATTCWEKGPYGLLEPRVPSTSPFLSKTAVAESPIPQLDLIFVPGIAFGERGERIGRGGGYYDRFLASLPDGLRLALLYDFQLFESLEQQSWDQSVHWIITELRERKLPFVSEWLKRKLS